MFVRHGLILLLTGSLVGLGLSGDALRSTVAQGGGKIADGDPPKKKGDKKPFAFAEDEIIQEFPVGADRPLTAWKVRYIGVNPGPGLVITGAWFKTAPEGEWLKVIENIRLSEIFVPYNNGTRIYDIGAQASYSLLKHTQEDAGANGKLRNDGHVVHEIRDTGILWKYYKQVRRGQELVLWSTLGASNYNYLVEYSFRGDGVITCRMGSTGRNFGNHETVGHMHHACWRIDVDLDDPEHNSVFLVKRKEPKQPKGRQTAEDVIEKFNGGIEGGAHWNAEEFTRLRIECNKRNGQDKKMCYELLPLRPGSPRHWKDGEEFTHYDFWVTPYQWDQQHYTSLPRFVSKKREIEDTNIVVWYMSPAYHLPRDEDGVFISPKGQTQIRGVAMTTWSGFELRPRNVFEKTPLFP